MIKERCSNAQWLSFYCDKNGERVSTIMALCRHYGIHCFIRPVLERLMDDKKYAMCIFVGKHTREVARILHVHESWRN